MNVTIKEIAKHAGVSVGSVSHVINGSAGVGPDIKARVERAIADLGYTPNPVARGLRQQRTRMIAMIIPDITNPYFPSVVRGAEDLAFEHGLQIVLCNTDNDPVKEAAYLRTMVSYSLSGLLIIPSVGDEQNHPLHDGRPSGIPTLCLDRKPMHWGGDVIVSDNAEGGRLVARHFLQSRHTRIAIIRGPDQFSNAFDRQQGFLSELTSSGLHTPDDYIEQGAFDIDGGRRAAQRLLSLSTPPTAIFASNDLMALDVLTALEARGLSCPNDVSVVGFDNLDVAAITRPGLTTVDQSGYTLGRAGLSRLLARMDAPDLAPETLQLPVRLVHRGSVCPPQP
ncbi:hypothetical protein AEAC466_05290 [Asticcacaulis sp. AC466]|uniref:LacI family DNA-binding transcriptional regulator n=1 Tax=Asticcacaulis sp. AC466 TaxID=1282362 RepID=UPI0003C3EA60|nr:LacI family DNA-binding transcriptional regulator [Asticcacaulis sp. AC466]ESQ85126.1 hypothetical protein AEAC466_05290 [Asticcacaulis sp. AC466]